MARTEYYDDPDAPKPNSLVVAASAVVTDEEGRILLQRRRDNDLWALPGGGMEMTDSLPGAAVREVKEETGLDVEITGLVGTYTDRATSSPIRTVRCVDSSMSVSPPEWSADGSRSQTNPRSCDSSRPTSLPSCPCTTPSGYGFSTFWNIASSRTSVDARVP